MSKLTNCDGLFKSPPTTTQSDCGKATFQGFTECGNNVGCNTTMEYTGCSNCYVLPVPWAQDYKDDWRAFLKALNIKYGSDSSLVSIAVAGPTAASVEMIL